MLGDVVLRFSFLRGSSWPRKGPDGPQASAARGVAGHEPLARTGTVVSADCGMDDALLDHAVPDSTQPDGQADLEAEFSASALICRGRRARHPDGFRTLRPRPSAGAGHAELPRGCV